uniref:Uncharacterized protein n=1 Tax=Marmota marmota marmota TaxID=9994 RepID=A0A8C5YJA5_MARMA
MVEAMGASQEMMVVAQGFSHSVGFLGRGFYKSWSFNPLVLGLISSWRLTVFAGRKS